VRPLKFATHLAAFGIDAHVLAPTDPRWIHEDRETEAPPRVTVHRAPYLGPRGRALTDDLYGRGALARAAVQAGALGRRLIVPDEHALWVATAVPAAVRIVRRERVDVVLTTSPPGSVHVAGALVKALTGVRWVADLRDSMLAHPHRRSERAAVRAKERTERLVARLVAARADAVVAAAGAIADEFRPLRPRGPLVTIENGCDFDDFAGLEYRPSARFRITHTGLFFGRRDPQPFLQALAEAGLDVSARFVGGLRPRDAAYARSLGLGDHVVEEPYVPRRRALAVQRDSEALLLLIPDIERAHGTLSAKLWEYLAAQRPILAAVPPDGAAAAVVRAAGAGVVVPPNDVAGLRDALTDLVSRFRAGTLAGPDADVLRPYDRIERAGELADLLRSLA
jgi:glycosyltransferase involved in cell wall biosynthesis